MAKVEVTSTELVWPGKYDEDGTLKDVPRVSLPFQVIETVNESRASREAKKGGVQGTLFDVYEGKEGDTFEAGWRNKLIWGDNLLVMGSLLEKFAGKIFKGHTQEIIWLTRMQSGDGYKFDWVPKTAEEGASA